MVALRCEAALAWFRQSLNVERIRHKNDLFENVLPVAPLLKSQGGSSISRELSNTWTELNDSQGLHKKSAIDKRFRTAGTYVSMQLRD
jgi:hypothetical protein